MGMWWEVHWEEQEEMAFNRVTERHLLPWVIRVEVEKGRKWIARVKG